MGNCHVLQVSTSICLHVLLHCLSNGLRRTHTHTHIQGTYTNRCLQSVAPRPGGCWFLIVGRDLMPIELSGGVAARCIFCVNNCARQLGVSGELSSTRAAVKGRTLNGVCAPRTHTHMHTSCVWALGLPHCCGTLQRLQVVFIPLILLTIRIYTVISINNAL